jgi:hypothetical protein
MGQPDGGYLEMDTGAVLQHMTALHGVADTLADVWAATRAEADGLRGGIGTDFLGHFFHRVHDPDEAKASELASSVPPALRGSAQVGEQCAYLYRSADADGRDTMASEAGSHGPR